MRFASVTHGLEGLGVREDTGGSSIKIELSAGTSHRTLPEQVQAKHERLLCQCL
jgi:hypothetical protein